MTKNRSKKNKHPKAIQRITRKTKLNIFQIGIGVTKKTVAWIKSNAKKTKISKFRALKSQIYPSDQDLTKKIKLIKRLAYFGVLFGISFWLFWDIPLPTNLTKDSVPVSTKLFDRNGKLLFEIYSDKRSTPVALEDLPDYVKEATISIEDKDFYKHYGVSVTGITRALYKTIIKGRLQGGSTLTQQLVKNVLLTPERTVKRKIREFALTLFVETIYSKNQILELYLNQIPYGSTAYGIGAASELYFGKSAKDLSLAEATLLAGLPAAPSLYSPFGAHPEYAKERQALVLSRMVEDKYVSGEDAEKAKNENISYSKQENLKAPHFSLWVKQLLSDEYGESVVEKGGLRVTTTLDLDLQSFAQDAVATEVAKLKKQAVGNGAAIVVRPGSGEILAMVGSKDYDAEDEDGKVNILFSNRQPGSSIKPINYALALRDKKITASSLLADIPTCFSVVGQKEYCPKNYDGSYHGMIQARYALGNSLNVPAVRVLALNGLKNFVEFANKMGIKSFSDPSRYGLSLTLGGGEVKPVEMATAFGVLANSGIKEDLNPIIKIEDWKGKVLKENNFEKLELSGEKVLDSNVTFIISHVISDNGTRSMAFGTNSFLNVKGHSEVSVKTGTTNDFKDNWTIGYTPQILVLTWVGNNDNTPMRGAVSGVSGASPIWNKIIKEALDKSETGAYNKKDSGHSSQKQPTGVVGISVCSTTGSLPSDPLSAGCPTRFEYFLKESVPADSKGGRADVRIDKTTNSIANDDTPAENVEVRQQSVLYDALGSLVCLDCPVPAASQSAKISYPL